MRTCLVILLFLLTSLAYAADHDVTLVWEFPDTTDIAHFECRLNGDNSTLISILGGDSRAWSGTMDLNDGENLIDVRGRDEGGQVGEWSDSVSYDPIPGKPVVTITILK